MLIRDMMKQNNASFVILMETRTSGERIIDLQWSFV